MTIKYEVLIFLKCSSGKLTDTWMHPLMRIQGGFEMWTVNNGLEHLKIAVQDELTVCGSSSLPSHIGLLLLVEAVIGR